MLKSMTGFGAAEAEGDGCRIHVELRSVNHRFLDISLRLPRPLLAFEDTIKTRLRQRIDRGRVSLSFGFESRDELEEIALNASLVQAYIGASRQVAAQIGVRDSTMEDPAAVGSVVAAVLSQPDVLMRNFKPTDSDKVRLLLNECIDKAVDQADEMKEREGRALGEDLGRRLDAVAESLQQVEARAPQVPEEAKAALRARLAKLTDGGEVDPQRLAQEVAILADRSDITEECVRLHSHLKQFRDNMISATQGARRMGFLLQEMHREVNTVGSKTGTLDITNEVLRMKEEIEKLREQVQNLE
jgi:uncharacterized protein (TIGR00255 family)